MGRVQAFLSKKRVTFSLILVFLVTYPLELLIITQFGIETFEFWFLFPPGFEPTPAWILALFAHGTTLHLAGNILGVLVYGLVLERYVAGSTYLTVYMLTGILAGLIHTNFTGSTGAGASGAIMGIFGFYAIVYIAMYRPDEEIDPSESIRYTLAILGPPVIVAQYAIDIYVNNGGYVHVAGGIIGILLGLVFVGSQVENPVSNLIELAKEAPFRTALLVLVVAETVVIVYLLIATPENPSISTAIQAGATIILVLITIWYANHTRRSAKLFRRELELETQRNHAETLQSRISTWLEDFPAVGETDVPLFADRDSMYAVPESLRDDPYFEDLTTNHASDIQDSVGRIDDLYTEFLDIRDDFVDNLSIDEHTNMRQIDILEENYAKWLFERVLLLERTDKDKKDLKSAVGDAFETKALEEDDYFRLIGDTDQFRKRAIMLYHYKRSFAKGRKDPYMFRIYATGPQRHIDEIESVTGYSDAVGASELLDDIETELRELEKQLIEYNEAPRFEGECDLILDID
ncbi:rhomboid family intramembrane serine protease [Halonotius roseus]|uniref:Rhomboid family intramembrane serine protease n=1 Tax=Halonotius roseus TaxID=2511997 RepID=A0A544QNU2_9EURY|nr:rhomboid family intramembrane serine protease [Halonotius roseus]TQQ80544.1 rhomboid family intramembrane serine protease [Halonotius roseus]